MPKVLPPYTGARPPKIPCEHTRQRDTHPEGADYELPCAEPLCFNGTGDARPFWRSVRMPSMSYVAMSEPMAAAVEARDVIWKRMLQRIGNNGDPYGKRAPECWCWVEVAAQAEVPPVKVEAPQRTDAQGVPFLKRVK